MKNTLRKSFLLRQFFLTMALTALVVGGAFAQRVGDTVQVFGDTYTVESVSGNRVTLVKPEQQARADNPVNWTAVASSPFGTSPVLGVAFGNNTWVAVGGGTDRNDAGKIAYSADGRTWTLASQTIFGNNQSINAVAYANNMFIAGGAKIATSTDGRTWTEVSSPLQHGITGIAFGGGRWVIVADRGQTAYSTDGRAWTTVAANNVFSTAAVGLVHGVAYGNNRFVVVGARESRIGYSPNGAAWTAVADSTFGIGTVRGIAFGGNRWVSVGTQGKMAYSADGATWTAVTAANNPLSGSGGVTINGVGFGNNRYVAVGDSGKMAYSADGAAWTAVANSTFGTSNINAIAYGSGRFVTGGADGKIAYSDW